MLDACAMIAYLRDEPGAEVVEEILDGEENCLAHVINLCEVYYDFVRSADESTANEAIEDLEAGGVFRGKTSTKNFSAKQAATKAA